MTLASLQAHFLEIWPYKSALHASEPSTEAYINPNPWITTSQMRQSHQPSRISISLFLYSQHHYIHELFNLHIHRPQLFAFYYYFILTKKFYEKINKVIRIVCLISHLIMILIFFSPSLFSFSFQITMSLKAASTWRNFCRVIAEKSPLCSSSTRSCFHRWDQVSAQVMNLQ